MLDIAADMRLVPSLSGSTHPTRWFAYLPLRPEVVSPLLAIAQMTEQSIKTVDPSSSSKPAHPRARHSILLQRPALSCCPYSPEVACLAVADIACLAYLVVDRNSYSEDHNPDHLDIVAIDLVLAVAATAAGMGQRRSVAVLEPDN